MPGISRCRLRSKTSNNRIDKCGEQTGLVEPSQANAFLQLVLAPASEICNRFVDNLVNATKVQVDNPEQHLRYILRVLDLLLEVGVILDLQSTYWFSMEDIQVMDAKWSRSRMQLTEHLVRHTITMEPTCARSSWRLPTWDRLVQRLNGYLLRSIGQPPNIRIGAPCGTSRRWSLTNAGSTYVTSWHALEMIFPGQGKQLVLRTDTRDDGRDTGLFVRRGAFHSSFVCWLRGRGKVKNAS